MNYYYVKFLIYIKVHISISYIIVFTRCSFTTFFQFLIIMEGSKALKGPFVCNITVNDVTKQFNGNVDSALEHFRKHSGEQFCVVIKSSIDNCWYMKTFNEQSKITFLPIPEEFVGVSTISVNNMTSCFDGSVGKAIEYFSDFPHVLRLSVIYSNSKKRWYINSVVKPNIFFPAPQDIIQILNQSGPKQDDTMMEFEETKESEPSIPQAPKLVESSPVINIWAFDLDLTLTTSHTGGVFNRHGDTQIDYFRPAQRKVVLDMFKRIKQDEFSFIYIVTRGVVQKVREMLRNTFPELLYYIDGIYGSLFASQVCSEEYTDSVWANKKLNYLCAIENLDDAFDTRVYFFDDTEINVQTVNNCGLSNMHAYKVEPLNNEITNVATLVNEILNKE